MLARQCDNGVHSERLFLRGDTGRTERHRSVMTGKDFPFHTLSSLDSRGGEHGTGRLIGFS